MGASRGQTSKSASESFGSPSVSLLIAAPRGNHHLLA